MATGDSDTQANTKQERQDAAQSGSEPRTPATSSSSKGTRSESMLKLRRLLGSDESEALSLEQVLQDELVRIHGPDIPAGDSSDPIVNTQSVHFDRGTASLCFSGGGIRSAAFCLGVARALAKQGLLKQFHYFSSISGGGYTASFLSAWAYRAERGIAEVEEQLGQAAGIPQPPAKPYGPVAWLRRYSSYLSPRLGITSADAWTLPAIYIRNLLINWTVLFPMLLLIAVVPFLVSAIITAPARDGTALDYLIGPGILLFAVGQLILRARTCSTGVATTGLHWWVVGLLFAGASLITAAKYSDTMASGSRVTSLDGFELTLALVGISVALATGFVVYDLLQNKERTSPTFDRLLLWLGFVSASLMSGFVIAAWFDFVSRWQTLAIGDLQEAFFVLIGPPSLVLALLLPEVAFVGLAGKLSDDQDREWWSRTVALVLRAAATWAAAGALALLGPSGFRLLRPIAGEVVGPAAYTVNLLLAGLVARLAFQRIKLREPVSAASAATGSAAPGRVTDITLNTVGALLIVGLFIGLAALVEQWVSAFPCDGGKLPGTQIHYCIDGVMFFLIYGFAVMLFFSMVVHINRYSLHAMYRDRLVRAFLAASRGRRPVPPRPFVLEVQEQEAQQFDAGTRDGFTDLDRHDNPLLRWLNPARRDFVPQASSPQFVRAPLLVANCALNMVGDRDHALQERKALPFTLSPLHCGSPTTGYRSTRKYGGPLGMSLGTALTISGAAVSPNAGSRSTPVMTFLLTLFNARLGWWLGNPKSSISSPLTGPAISFVPMFRELLGRTDDKGDWIYLSDGGHFDNLGLYEMVRRGCRYIVAVDASSDPQRTFDDLGNVIRMVRIDFGVEISRREAFQIGGREKGSDGRYAALFDVVYPPVKGKTRVGRLLYVKTAIYPVAQKGAPIDVVEYGSRSMKFPHEPTSDQFFLESQFESYRALGEHEMMTIMTAVNVDFVTTVPDIFDAATQYIKTS